MRVSRDRPSGPARLGRSGTRLPPLEGARDTAMGGGEGCPGQTPALLGAAGRSRPARVWARPLGEG